MPQAQRMKGLLTYFYFFLVFANLLRWFATQRRCYENLCWYSKKEITYTQVSSTYFVLFVLLHKPNLQAFRSYPDQQ